MNRLLIAALTVMLSLAFVSTSSAQQTQLKIATANPAKIFNDMQETKDLKEKLEADSKELGNQEKQIQANIQGLQDKLKQLVAGTQQYADTRKELIQQAVQYDTWKKIAQAQIQDAQKTQMKLLFDKITEAVKAVAKEQNLDLVLAETNVEFPDIEQINVDQLRALINQRNVMFSSGNLDISAAVTAKLDAAYKTRGTTPPVTPPAVKP